MVRIILHNKLHIKFVTENLSYLRALKDYFTEKVKNYYFSPLAQSGLWHGEIRFFDGRSKTLPYGVLDDVLRFHKNEFPDETLKIDDEVKDLYKDLQIKISFDLALKPYPYQEESVRKLLRYTKGIVRVATAGGKSLIVAYLIDNLRKNNLSKKCLVIVPTIILLNQFKSDFIEYGMDGKLLGLIGDSSRDFNTPITVSTWQSLQVGKKVDKSKREFLIEKLLKYDTVIVDETHLAQSNELKNILEECKNARFRFGLTGTLHDDRLDILNTKAFLGPVIAEYSAAQLAKEGYISKSNVIALRINYDDEVRGSYDEIKDKIFNDPFRLSIIEFLINNIKENFLLLVGLVEKEGVILEKFLKEKFPKKKIVFLSGKVKDKERQEWRKRMNEEKNIILIATYKLFQLGVNIPALKFLILASPYKSKIRVLQSIGRLLRKYFTKVEGAYTIDLWDTVRTLERHGEIRMRFYVREEFTVMEYSVWKDDISDLHKMLSSIK